MLTCPHEGCQYNTRQDLTEDMNPTAADHIAMLGHHRGAVHGPLLPPPQVQPPPAQNVTRVRPPELRLLDGKIEEPDWDALLAEWDNFKVAGNLQVGTEKHQLGSVLGPTRTKVFGRLGPAAYAALTEQGARICRSRGTGLQQCMRYKASK